MYHDPYSGQQIKSFRSDPTGRWSPIVEEDYSSDDTWMLIGGGIVAAIGLALMFFWGI